MAAITAPTTPRAFRFPGQRKFEHSLLIYRRIWRGTVFGTIVSPILFLTAMGVALGSLVPTMTTFGGVPYIVFLAPGLMAAQAMQTGTQESSWPLIAGFRWNKTFEAMITTPQGVRDIVLGHLYWLIVRIGVVTGVSFAMPMAAWTATRQNEQSFSVIFRFIITPLFLFSGTFFPIEQLPPVFQTLAWFTPLFHGVALTRALAIGHPIEPLVLVIHALVLVALVVVGTLLAFRTFRNRLVI
jgi:lipooligosaccharide transport system permease protein